MGFSRDGLNFSCAGSEGPVLKFFQIASKIRQGILKIPPNYLKKKTQMFSQILLKQFKDKTMDPRDSFKLLNQTQELLEILSNYFKNQTLQVPEILSHYVLQRHDKDPKDYFTLLQKQNKRSPRGCFKLLKNQTKGIIEILSKYFKNRTRDL